MNTQKLHISLGLTLGLLAAVGLLTLLAAAGGGPPVVQAQGINTHSVAADDDCGGATPCYSTIQALLDAAPAATSGGVLRFPLSGEPTTLDPAQYEGGYATSIQMQIFEGLTQYDQNLNAIPAIASSWSTPDAQVWTFHLRHDVYFHNGRQVKANDFVYAWDRAKSAGGSYVSFFFDDVAAFSAADDFTFVVTLTAPAATFPVRIAVPPLAVIPSEAVGAIGTSPVGTGPFEFVSWTAGNKIVLRRFSGYYATPAYLAGVEYKFIEDTDAQWAEFQAGNLDVTLIPVDRWSATKMDPNVLTSTTMRVTAYGFHTAAFPDVRVRKAFQAAINRAAIVSDPAVAPYDPLPVAHGVVSPGKGSYDNSDIVIPYDPTGALNLLAAAGWTDTNGDGILDNGAGDNLSVVVQDFTDTGQHAMALRIADDLADIGGTGVGASVTATTTPSTSNLRRTGWGTDYPAPDNDLSPYETGSYHSTSLQYSSATFDTYLAVARTTLDESARNAVFHSADAHLVLTDAVVLPISYSATQILKKSYVRDLRLTEWGAIPLKYAWLDFPYKVHLPLIQR